MKYTNASSVLPQELVEMIQSYVQGEYLYIPIKEKNTEVSQTDYKIELEKRDAHIFTKYLEGVGNRQLSQIYNLSESSIRRIIIKQKRYYDVMRDKISEIITHWGLTSISVKQIYDTAWQVGDKYILKVYDNLHRLERNLKMINTLEEMNIPVGRIVYSSENKMYVTDGEYHYFLAEKLPGSNIVDINAASDIAVSMGETIAALHRAFQVCEKSDVFWNNSLLDEMNGWVKGAFEENGWKFICRDAYEKVVTALGHNYNCLPVQLIHRDVHFGNFLFDNGKFSGYIDFDLSQRNIRIFDLCYFLLGLLSEEEKMEITEEQWFDIVGKVFYGYEEKNPLSEEEKSAVPVVMECIELLFVAWFLKQKDICCAENALDIYNFVNRQEQKIRSCITSPAFKSDHRQ